MRTSNILKAACVFFAYMLLLGCSSDLNMPVYEPLVNAELVTIEVTYVNDEACPGNSLQDAVAKFDEYVLGGVQIINSETTSTPSRLHIRRFNSLFLQMI